MRSTCPCHHYTTNIKLDLNGNVIIALISKSLQQCWPLRLQFCRKHLYRGSSVTSSPTDICHSWPTLKIKSHTCLCDGHDYWPFSLLSLLCAIFSCKTRYTADKGFYHPPRTWERGFFSDTSGSEEKMRLIPIRVEPLTLWLLVQLLYHTEL